MKLGSLFDGSGTAPLCAAMLGWEPVWASEIEPFPVKVTSKRFPRMRHLGDITQIDGGEIEPVDVIVGGSPCQDLSVAGKQAGLQSGTRSHLFYEMTRIVREMRMATNGRYPRWVVWENVPGAFSSNRGRDFYEVLKEFCTIADDPCDVPESPRGKGRTGADKFVWENAGCIMGDNFSLGWRVLDAQLWVPQRRRRIFLVADFGGDRAREVLFDIESRRGDITQSEAPRKGSPADVAGGTDGTVWVIEGNIVDRCSAQNGRGYCRDIVPTLTAQDKHAVAAIDCRNGALSKISGPLQANPTSLNATNPILQTQQAIGEYKELGVASTLNARDCKSQADFVVEHGKIPRKYYVRRLTPLECCRLQGFPDWWVYGIEAKPESGWWAENDIWRRVIDPHGEVQGSDSAMYKMWGNGMALPCMLFVLNRLKDKEAATWRT